jgi:outer membrane protein OmpA-like peptidoglycan-associated protein
MTRSIAFVATSLATCLLAACASTPAPQAAAPEPPPASFNQTLSGDALFEFGKSSIDNISPAGRAELDTLAARVAALPAVEVVHVIGHSDRIGSAAGNVELSRKRAAAVRGYLAAAGVPEDRITAVGRGSVEPVVTCEGEKGQALITCLAPNRRVDIKVVMP